MRVIVLTALLLAALAVILILALPGTDPSAAPGGDPIPGAVDKEKDPGMIHLPAYGSLTFTAGTKEQAVVLENPGENSCLIRISLILSDGTKLYRSELVEPGYYTKPITLVAPLGRGTYRDVTLQYECFTNDGKMTPLNGATSKLDITVE